MTPCEILRRYVEGLASGACLESWEDGTNSVTCLNDNKHGACWTCSAKVALREADAAKVNHSFHPCEGTGCKCGADECHLYFATDVPGRAAPLMRMCALARAAHGGA